MTASKESEKNRKKFLDKEYAHAFLQDYLSDNVAIQLKALRTQKGLTQKQLAELAGMEQPRICQLESTEYEGWTLNTLLRLAEALDVSAEFRFAPFSKIIEEISADTSPSHILDRSNDLQKDSAVQTQNDSSPQSTNTSIALFFVSDDKRDAPTFAINGYFPREERRHALG